MPRTCPAAVATLVVSLIVPACAARSTGLASRFLVGDRQHLEEPRTGPGAPLESFIARIREAQANARPHIRQAPPEMEQIDPGLQDALRALNTTLSPGPEHHRAVAEAYFRLRILDAAARHLDAALRLAPSDARAYDLRARVWRDAGFPAAGLPDAHRAAYFAPSSAAARNTLGILHYSLAQHDAARDAFERAVALDPEAGYAWNNLCYLAMAGEDWPRADAACRKAVALSPESSTALGNLADLQRRARPITPE